MLFRSDGLFGEYMVKNHIDIYNGYRSFADTIIQWTYGQGPNVFFWIKDPVKKIEVTSKTALKWTTIVAMPWAEHMSYKMGYTDEDNIVGNILMKIGYPMCKVMNKVFNRSEEVSLTKAYTIAGLGALFVGFVKTANFFGLGKTKKSNMVRI
mgnify:FL=1